LLLRIKLIKDKKIENLPRSEDTKKCSENKRSWKEGSRNEENRRKLRRIRQKALRTLFLKNWRNQR